jgi:hypothetical protein
VLRPLRLVIDNYPEGQVEHLDAVNNPGDPSAGTRLPRKSATNQSYILADYLPVPPIIEHELQAKMAQPLRMQRV